MSKVIDRTNWVMAEHGVPDSRLTVIKRVEDRIYSNGNKYAQWLCECNCKEHNKIILTTGALRFTKSCGCIQKEKASEHCKNFHKVNKYDLTSCDVDINDIQMKKPKTVAYLDCSYLLEDYIDQKYQALLKKLSEENIKVIKITPNEELLNLIKIVYNERLKDVPKILETPYVGNGEQDRLYPPYKFEIKMIRDKKFNDNLLTEIREFYK